MTFNGLSLCFCCVCDFVCLIFYIYISAVKQLIAINRIQNKSVSLHDIFVCTVYIYYVYIIHTHACI